MYRSVFAAFVVLLLASAPAFADALSDAEVALSEGRAAEALALIQEVDDSEVDDAVQLRFIRALALIEVGRPEDAIKVLRPVLARRPNLVRVRLELARAYFEAREDDRAAEQFRQALGGDLPGPVRVNILRYLDRIQRRRKWSGSFRAAVAPDTNVSSGTDDSQITLFGQQFELDDRAQRSSGVGIEAAGTLRRIFGDPSDLTRPEISSGFFMREYMNDEFDDYNFTLGAGIQRRIRFGSIYAGPRVLRRHFGGAPLSQTYGMEGRVQRRIHPQLLGFGTGFIGYRNGLMDNDREDAFFVNAQAGLSRPLTSTLTLNGSVTARREEAPLEFDSSTRIGADLMLAAEVPLGFRLTATPGISADFFDAVNPIFGERENRVTYRATFGVTNRLISYWGFSPSVSLQLSKQTSDVPIFEYDRARLLLGVENTF